MVGRVSTQEMSNQDLLNAKKQVTIARNELKNIREKIEALKKLQHTYVKQIEGFIEKYYDERGQMLVPSKTDSIKDQRNSAGHNQHLEVKVIGFIHSAFKYKNATPRQSSICTMTTATLVLNKEYFTNPHHTLDGLQDFSHVWVMFIFHKNNKQSYCKGKVAPPRLDGKRIGVFSTRSPHRPNPIGLSLARLIKVEGDTLYLSGIDAVDGTPVVDIKPYIPAYDQPNVNQESVNKLQESSQIKELAGSSTEAFDNQSYTIDQCQSSHKENKADSCKTADADLSMTPVLHATVPCWIDSPPVKTLTVHWTTRAMQSFCTAVDKEMLTSDVFIFCQESEIFKTITSILKEDPRSIYRRHQCSDKLYYFTFDFLHLTCWFDNYDSSVEILKVCKL